MFSERGYGGERTPEPLSVPTKKLFQAIDDENLEAFEQALAEGANVNAFDEEGMTPLMSTANAYITSNDQPTLEKVAKLLIQNRSININAQSKQPVYEEKQKRDSQGRKVFQYLGREIVCQSGNRYMYCDDKSLVKDDEGLPILFTTNPSNLSFIVGSRFKLLTEMYEGVMERVKTGNTEKNTALHVACQVGAKNIVKILLTRPDVETDVRNCEYKSPMNCIARGFENIIKLEFEEAQKGKELLDALSNRDIYQAKTLLNQDLNPNCWERNKNGEIETPLSLIIKSCLQTITRDKEEVLTKLLKHKELDFSQIKSIPAIEQNIQLKRIIEQAIKGRLIDTIDKKDLDDVKKLVEDNCFMSYAVVAAALRDVGDPIESITDYLNEKFPVSVEQSLSEGFKQAFQGIAIELESVQAQLAEKEKDLKQAEREKVDQQAQVARLTKENAQLRAQN